MKNSLELSSSISSLESSPDELHALAEDARDKVTNYVPYCASDMSRMTKLILSSFIDYLPSDGKRVLCQSIVSNHQREALSSLGDHLAKAILAPSLVSSRMFRVNPNRKWYSSEKLK